MEKCFDRVNELLRYCDSIIPAFTHSNPLSISTPILTPNNKITHISLLWYKEMVVMGESKENATLICASSTPCNQ